MPTAKLFKHGGSQAVRLPRAFRFEGDEVRLERRGASVILRPLEHPRLTTLADVARHLASLGPVVEFPGEEPATPAS